MALILGAAAGFVLDDLLRAAGMHWLVWPVVGAFAMISAVTGIVVRRRARR